MRNSPILLFLLITTIANSQEFYHVQGTEKILTSKDSIQPYLKNVKNNYNKTSVEKYGYIANSVSYNLGETFKRNDSTITWVQLSLDLQKVDYKRERVFELENKMLPKIELLTLEGNKIDNKSIQGEVTFINLWFVNCAPCLKEIPKLNEIRKEFVEEVKFIAVTFDPKEKVLEFIKKEPFDFQIAYNQMDLLKEGFKVTSYPKILIVDKTGKISLISNGIKEYDSETENVKHSVEEIEELLRDLVAK